MKTRDILAVGLPALFEVEATYKQRSKCTVLAAPVVRKREFPEWRDGKRVMVLHNERRDGKPDGALVRLEVDAHPYEAGMELYVPLVHVIEPWSEAHEEALQAALAADRAFEELRALSERFGLPMRRAGMGAAKVDVAALRRVLDAFDSTRESEHLTLAVLAAGGDENAQAVVAGMDAIERLRFDEVARLAAPELAEAAA